MTNIGIELELGEGAGSVLHALDRLGRIDGTDVCEYHCECDRCTPHRSHSVWTAQEDCSIPGGAEFITRILAYGTAEYEDAVSAMGKALLQGRPIPDENSGNHIHVARDALDEAEHDAWINLWKIVLRYQDYLVDYIATGYGQSRDYNTPVRPPDVARETENGTRWLSHEDSLAAWFESPRNLSPMKGNNVAVRDETVEFRLWNASRSEWRLRMHVGLSVGMVAAAADPDFDAPTLHDERSFAEVIDPYLDNATRKYLARQISFASTGKAA